LLLVGCSKIFDSNLFSALDKLPALDQGKLSSASTDDINQMSKDPTFYNQLKDDPAALKTVQDSLTKVVDDPAATATARIAAAATVLSVTTNGSEVASLSTSAINNAATIKDALAARDFVGVIKIFLGTKTEPEIVTTLNNLLVMSTTLTTMQRLSTIPAPLPLAGTIDSTTFFSGSTDQGAFAQSAMMAAIGQALTIDGGGTVAGTAAILSQAKPVFPSHVELDAFTKAYDATDPKTVLVADTQYKPTTYSYAYVTTIKGKLVF